MSESGSDREGRNERAAADLTACFAANAALFGHNGGAFICLLKDLINEKLSREAFAAEYARQIEPEVALPDDIVIKVWELRAHLRDGPARSSFFFFLGVRRALTIDQARVMKAEALEVVKEELEDPAYPDSGPTNAPKKRRVAREQWSCLCDRKFQAYVPLVIHAANCNKIDRLPQVDELPQGFIGKMKDPRLSAQDLLESWNSLIPPPSSDSPPVPAAPGPSAPPPPPFYHSTPAHRGPPAFLAKNGPPNFASSYGFGSPMPPHFPPSAPSFPTSGPSFSTSGPNFGAPFGVPVSFASAFPSNPMPPPQALHPPTPHPPTAQGTLEILVGLVHGMRRDTEMLGMKVDQATMRMNGLEKKLIEMENLIMTNAHQILDKFEDSKVRTQPNFH